MEFTTTQDTVTLSVPARYENEITADDSFMIEAPETGEHDLDDVLFSFYDKSQAAEDRLGLVWAIRAFQFEDPAELVKDGADRWVEENLMALNTHLLGTRGSTAFYFFCLSPSDKAVRQYDSSDTAAVSSYYQHAADGLDILKDFVVRNGLAPVEGAVDWEAWYQEFILPRIEAETDPAADAAWFAAREPVEQWPEFTVNGTSIYDLTLDELTPAFGKPTRIYHWMDIGTEYYDVVQFPDASQIAGWIDEDGTIHHPDGSQAAGWVGDGELHLLNAAYLRLESGTEVCGIRYSWNYFAAANLFPRDAEPVLEQIDEHTTRLRLGGEITYMGKYSYIEYMDGIPTMLVVCNETVMTFYIENGVIAAVSWMAPEEAMRLPITEQEAQQRMTIDPSLLTDENLLSILIGPEIALVNNGFTFDSPADLSSEKLFMLFLYWSVDSTRDNYKQADGKYHFTQDFINGILSHYFRTGSFTFDITQCRNYDASEGTAVIENVSGFGGGPDLRIADVQVLEVLLYYAAPRGDTNPTAHALLSRFGTLDSVFSAPESELKKVNGVGDAAAQLIRLVPQVARRCLMSRSAQIEILDTTSKCGQYLLPYFHGESEEVVYLLCLDAKCKALDCVLIHRGGVNVASIAARKVVKAALDANATSVVLAHNHPSGLALPSPEDRQTTLVLKAALEAVGIVLADHIIVADDDFVSLRDDGILEDPYEL